MNVVVLDVVEDRSVYLEEFSRTQIGQEELHGLELRKMLRDIGVEHHHIHGGKVTSIKEARKRR